jgi:hypothetical protein
VDTDVKEEEGLGFRVQVLVNTDVKEEEGIQRWGEGGRRRGGDVGQGLNMDACFEGLGFRGRWSRLEHGRLL